jgi:iron-sulfur cluster repair protein YtfE (RIC family)
MNAIKLLKADHKTVDQLFQKVEATDDKEHPAIFKKIKDELTVHAHIEEAVLYPDLQEKGDKELQDLTLEALQEHHQMKIFLREISALADDSEQFEPKLKVLIEDTRHHVMEEEGEMFPMLEEQFKSAQIEEWGDLLKAEKQKYAKRSKSASR